MSDSVIEQTLGVWRGVAVYKIPPRPTAGGHKSGEWKVADRIFTARLRVVSIGEFCEIRLEDPDSNENFAMCPVLPGQREQAVESAADSSRYFVFRLVDPESGRHAFLGVGFEERGDAFDFNVCLSDHEKWLTRARDASSVRAAGSELGTELAATEAAALYKQQDLSLKEGQTITINVKRTSASDGGFLSQLGSSNTGSSGLKLLPLTPPPATSSSQPTGQGQMAHTASAPTRSSSGAAASTLAAGTVNSDPWDLLSSSSQPSRSGAAPVQAATAAFEQFEPFGDAASTSATQTDWATFD